MPAPEFQRFWNQSIAEVWHQIELHEQYLADSIGLDTRPSKGLVEALNAFVSSADEGVSRHPGGNFATGGHGVDKDDPHALAIVRSQQSDVAQLLKSAEIYASFDRRKAIEGILAADKDQLELMFGSFTRAWDALVNLKVELLKPDRRADSHASPIYSPEPSGPGIAVSDAGRLSL